MLLATAKLALQDAIEHGDLGRRSGARAPICTPPSRRRCARSSRRRSTSIGCAREIIATKLANRLVNRLGVLHPFELAEEEGASLRDIAAMFVVAERLFDLDELWREIETPTMAEDARLALFDEVAVAVRGHIADLLRVDRAGASPADVIARLEPGHRQRSTRRPRQLLLDEVKRAERRAFRAPARARGRARAIWSTQVVRLFELDGAVGLADLGARRGIDEIVLTRAFTHARPGARARLGAGDRGADRRRRSVGAAADRRPRARFRAAAARIPRRGAARAIPKRRSRPGSPRNGAARRRSSAELVDRARASAGAQCGDARPDRGPGARAAGAGITVSA